MKVGVIIGRFQVSQLTEGHTNLIAGVTRSFNITCVLLGVAAERNVMNPLDFVSRYHMITTAFPGIVVMPLHDVPGDDKTWSYEVDSILDLTFPGAACTLVGGRDSFLPHYLGQFSTLKLELGQADWSGTQHRGEIVARGPVNNADFRAGVIYAVCSESNSPDRQLQSHPLETIPTGNDTGLQLL